MKLGYYPGCSLHATSREFDESVQAIAGQMGWELEEIDDWSCCGATSGHATNYLLSISLAGRNLSLAEAQGMDRVLTPCAACYSRLATAQKHMAEDRELAKRVGKLLKRPFNNTVRVLSIVEALRDLAPSIKEKVTKPLSGLKVACYYGCLLLRPHEVTEYDDPEDPSSLETVAQAVGAQPVSWRMRLECCGGAFSIARTGSVIRLGRAILEDARAAGADAIVLACPMCHTNLDLRQKAIMRKTEPSLEPMPILFISQLVGLGLGLGYKALSLKRHFINTRPFVDRAARSDAVKAESEGA